MKISQEIKGRAEGRGVRAAKGGGRRGGGAGGRRRGGGREGKLVKEGKMLSLLFPSETIQESKQAFFQMGWILISSEHRQCLKPLHLLINCSVSSLSLST